MPESPPVTRARRPVSLPEPTQLSAPRSGRPFMSESRPDPSRYCFRVSMSRKSLVGSIRDGGESDMPVPYESALGRPQGRIPAAGAAGGSSLRVPDPRDLSVHRCRRGAAGSRHRSRCTRGTAALHFQREEQSGSHESSRPLRSLHQPALEITRSPETRRRSTMRGTRRERPRPRRFMTSRPLDDASHPAVNSEQ